MYLIEEKIKEGKVDHVEAALHEFNQSQTESTLLDASFSLQTQLQPEEIQTQ